MTVYLTKQPAAPNTAGEVPPLIRKERVLLGVVGTAAVGVGGLGLASSFDSVERAARAWGFEQGWMLPVGIDIAIPVFTAANLLLIRVNMPLAWARFIPWALTLVTCWLNIAAGTTVTGKVAHGAMPLLWVALSEVAAHTYASRIGAVTGQRMDRIRLSRWFLAFPSTFALWRRMVLWETTSYTDALTLERDRLLIRAQLREKHGRNWRRKAPRQTRVMLKLGETAPAGAQPDTDKAPAPEPEPKPEPEVESAAKKPEPKVAKPPRRRTAKPKAKTGKAASRLSFDDQLDKAREITAGWADKDLNAEQLREAVGCGQDRSRQLRDILQNERAQHSPPVPAMPAPDTATGPEHRRDLEGATA